MGGKEEKSNILGLTGKWWQDIDFSPHICLLNEGKNASVMCSNGHKLCLLPVKNGRMKEHTCS